MEGKARSKALRSGLRAGRRAKGGEGRFLGFQDVFAVHTVGNTLQKGGACGMKISDMDSLKIFQKRELCMDGERVLEGNVFQVKGMKKHDAHESDCQAITEYRVKNHFSSVHVNFSIWVPDSGYCCAKTFSNAAKENQT